MGKREKIFKKLLSHHSKKIDDFIASKPTLGDIQKSETYKQFVDVYKKLGGVLETPPYKIGKYDIIVDGRIIELDEEAHFNRYRSITLEADVYREHKYFNVDNYKKYCPTKENKVRSYGKFWSTPSCEKQFGKANKNGNLNGNGSPRWKQRAFYDFIKDLIPTIFGIPLFRIAIYDELIDDHGKLHSVDEILKKEDIERFALIYNKIIS
jgi:hypothetical protein